MHSHRSHHHLHPLRQPRIENGGVVLAKPLPVFFPDLDSLKEISNNRREEMADGD